MYLPNLSTNLNNNNNKKKDNHNKYEGCEIEQVLILKLDTYGIMSSLMPAK